MRIAASTELSIRSKMQSCKEMSRVNISIKNRFRGRALANVSVIAGLRRSFLLDRYAAKMLGCGLFAAGGIGRNIRRPASPIEKSDPRRA